jgi:hypothetical protein
MAAVISTSILIPVGTVAVILGSVIGVSRSLESDRSRIALLEYQNTQVQISLGRNEEQHKEISRMLQDIRDAVIIEKAKKHDTLLLP